MEVVVAAKLESYQRSNDPLVVVSRRVILLFGSLPSFRIETLSVDKIMLYKSYCGK
jgi:hypothetical protein